MMTHDQSVMYAELGIANLLRHIGEDTSREGLHDTPARVVKAFTEMTKGYNEDPAEILSKTFDVAFDELVVLDGIEFVSLCEHHLLPFTGTATVAYLPGARVVGISKLARLVLCYARRLQVQERMTEQVADAMEKYLQCRGVGVIIRAHHACMSCRGVGQTRTVMTTSCLRGMVRENAALRSEFLQLR